MYSFGTHENVQHRRLYIYVQHSIIINFRYYYKNYDRFRVKVYMAFSAVNNKMLSKLFSRDIYTYIFHSNIWYLSVDWYILPLFQIITKKKKIISYLLHQLSGLIIISKKNRNSSFKNKYLLIMKLHKTIKQYKTYKNTNYIYFSI